MRKVKIVLVVTFFTKYFCLQSVFASPGDTLSYKQDSAIYTTVINAMTPKQIKSVFCVDTSYSKFTDFNIISASILSEFNKDLVLELYSDLSLKSKKLIHFSNFRINYLDKLVRIFDSTLNINEDFRDCYLFNFSRIAYSSDKNKALLFVKYRRLDKEEGGSSIIMLSYFWKKWHIVHVTEISVY